MQKIKFNNKTISFQSIGNGPAIILLHGYLETKEVWNEFATELSKSFKVISIDIPGHGKSELISEYASMNDLAEAVDAVLTHQNIYTHTIIGHSMGGYVALAYAKLYPKRTEKLVLFHSTVYADTKEKIKNRKREIDFIKKGKLELILQVNLPKMFANGNVVNHVSELNNIQNLAKKHNTFGICSILNAMMHREDYQQFSQSFDKPQLYIFGKKDNYIPHTVGEKMTRANPKAKVVWLNNSGHMGFIEEFDTAIKTITNFAKTK